MVTFLSFENCFFSPYPFFSLVTVISYSVFFCYPRCPEPKFLHPASIPHLSLPHGVPAAVHSPTLSKLLWQGYRCVLKCRSQCHSFSYYLKNSVLRFMLLTSQLFLLKMPTPATWVTSLYCLMPTFYLPLSAPFSLLCTNTRAPGSPSAAHSSSHFFFLLF